MIKSVGSWIYHGLLEDFTISMHFDSVKSDFIFTQIFRIIEGK